VRYEEARDRLRHLPHPLPQGPATLAATVLGRGTERPDWVTEGRVSTRHAAALVLIYPDQLGEAHVVLTERPTGELRHSGQISFPGGAMDPDDDFPVGTALREAAEEVALDATAAGVQILGVLETVDVRVSGFLLVPVLAAADQAPHLSPHPREVAAVLRVPLRHFLADAPIEQVTSERDGWRLRYGAYPVGEHRIWGATATILGQLGALLGPSTG
jgi:8-oxo-dGTP pyrophosphatase MutT (NUDIX family)